MIGLMALEDGFRVSASGPFGEDFMARCCQVSQLQDTAEQRQQGHGSSLRTTCSVPLVEIRKPARELHPLGQHLAALGSLVIPLFPRLLMGSPTTPLYATPRTWVGVGKFPSKAALSNTSLPQHPASRISSPQTLNPKP